MKLSIGIENFNELLNKGCSLDMIFLLKLIHEQNDVSKLIAENDKISAIYDSMERKGYFTDDKSHISLIGEELLIFAESKTSKRLPKVKSEENKDFLLWWTEYPSTDAFIYKNQQFSGCRGLKQNKEECRLKFNKIIIEGDYTPAQLIEALKYEIKAKKEQSFKSKTNKLSFMQNSLTYLNQRSFENFIDLIDSKIEEIQTITGTDI